MKNKHNIFLIGPMGSGKSTVGKYLASLLGYKFYDSDTVIEQRTGVSISWIFELEQEEGFRQRESKVIADLTREEGVVLATGGGVVITPENCQVLTEHGMVIYLTVSLDIQLQRTRHGKEGRPLLNCSDPKAKLQHLNQQRDPLYRSIADFIYNTDEFSPYKLALQIKEDTQVLQN